MEYRLSVSHLLTGTFHTGSHSVPCHRREFTFPPLLPDNWSWYLI